MCLEILLLFQSFHFLILQIPCPIIVACGDSDWYFGMNIQFDHQEYYCREDGSGKDWMEDLKEFKHDHMADQLPCTYVTLQHESFSRPPL